MFKFEYSIGVFRKFSTAFGAGRYFSILNAIFQCSNSSLAAGFYCTAACSKPSHRGRIK